MAKFRVFWESYHDEIEAETLEEAKEQAIRNMLILIRYEQFTPELSEYGKVKFIDYQITASAADDVIIK